MTEQAKLSPDLIMLGADKFRTDRRYMRAATAGAYFPIVKGKSLSVLYYSGTIYPACQIRYAVNGYNRQMTATDGGNGAVLSNTFAADFTLTRTE